ncbi:MAG: DUF1566 domain-containing protein [Proteobacteria bacterium]|nr:DUF1566 domain-containing protein [Pseudomonadota bacterium]
MPTVDVLLEAYADKDGFLADGNQSWYWTSTSCTDDNRDYGSISDCDERAWTVYYESAKETLWSKTNSFLVRCVRGLSVVKSDPLKNSIGNEVNKRISITFSNSIIPSSLTTNTVEEVCSGSFQLSVDNFSTCLIMASDPSMDSENKVFTFTPASDLQQDTTHEVKVTTEIQDIDGTSPTVEYRWVFKTGHFAAIDTVTNLMWQDIGQDTITNWSGAVDYCDNLSLMNLSDWRLPVKDELLDIGTRKDVFASFPFWPSYWSADGPADDSSKAWVVYLGDHFDPFESARDKNWSNSTAVLCVRP